MMLKKTFFYLTLSFLFIGTMAFIAMPTHSQTKKDAKVLNITPVVSPSGIKAWLVEDHSTPIISMKFAFRHGSAHDPEALNGVSQLLSNTLDEGAGPYDSTAFQKRLNDSSITLRYNNSRDYFSGVLKTLTKNKEEAFALLKLSLTEALFEEDAVDRMRQANLNRIKEGLGDPDWITARLTNDKAYEGHPYAKNSGGSLSSMASITPANLKTMAAEKITKENLVVAVTGDINPNELSIVLDLIFKNLPEKADKQDVQDISIQNKETNFVYILDIPQSFVTMTWDGVNRSDDDFYAAMVMNHILGGAGFGSRLTEEIREKRGLTYGIYSSLNTLDHAPSISVSTSTDHENMGDIIRITEKIIDDMKAEGPTDQEMNDAKNYLIGSMPLQLTSNDSIASILLGLQIDDLPSDYLDQREAKIMAVTKEDVQNVARKLFNVAPLTIMVGQPILPESYQYQLIEELPDAE
jgi:zinc protease